MWSWQGDRKRPVAGGEASSIPATAPFGFSIGTYPGEHNRNGSFTMFTETSQGIILDLSQFGKAVKACRSQQMSGFNMPESGSRSRLEVVPFRDGRSAFVDS
jgi:hypothetical protein